MKRREILLTGALALTLGILIGRSTVALPASATSQRAPASAYARFVGSWSHHGGALIVYANGHAVHRFRTYVDCNTSRLTACDRFLQNQIYDGGFSAFTLTRVVGNRAYGHMDSSGFSWQIGTTVTLVIKNDGTMRDLEAGFPVMVCGAQAKPGTCGA